VEALGLCKESYARVKGIELEEGVVNESSNSGLNFSLVKPIYEWSRGKDFIEICEYTDILEGAIIRSIQRIEMTLRNVRSALAIIGNTTLIEKIEAANLAIKRDIAFALSLYIEEADMS
jgi:antiviral helicase SKI2